MSVRCMPNKLEVIDEMVNLKCHKVRLGVFTFFSADMFENIWKLLRSASIGSQCFQNYQNIDFHFIFSYRATWFSLKMSQGKIFEKIIRNYVSQLEQA